MPIVKITFAQSLDDKTLRKVREVLPQLVSACVDCSDEPWTGPARPGDVDLQFYPRHELDVGGLDCVIEIHSKLFPSRAKNKQERVEQLSDALSPLMTGASFGVWLLLHQSAWTQRSSQ